MVEGHSQHILHFDRDEPTDRRKLKGRTITDRAGSLSDEDVRRVQAREPSEYELYESQLNEDKRKNRLVEQRYPHLLYKGLVVGRLVHIRVPYPESDLGNWHVIKDGLTVNIDKDGKTYYTIPNPHNIEGGFKPNGANLKQQQQYARSIAQLCKHNCITNVLAWTKTPCIFLIPFYVMLSLWTLKKTGPLDPICLENQTTR